MAQITLIEPDIKKLLEDNGITAEIDLGGFAEDSPARAVMIRRDDTPFQEIDLPVDTIRLMVVTRDTNPLTALRLANDVVNILHGTLPQVIGTAPNENFLFSSKLDSGPEREDDQERRRFLMIMFFSQRVRIDQT